MKSKVNSSNNVSNNKKDNDKIQLSSSLSTKSLKSTTELDDLTNDLIRIRDICSYSNINNYDINDKNDSKLLLSINMKKASRPFPGLDEEAHLWSSKLLLKYIREKIEIDNDDIEYIIIKNHTNGYKFICMDDDDLFSTSTTTTTNRINMHSSNR